MPDASLTLFADLGACHVQKSSVTICVLPAPSGWRVTLGRAVGHLQIEISIHALRTEGDVNLANVNLCHVISIHTLRVEGDPAAALGCLPTAHFYPRPPGGGRRPRTRAAVYKDLFLSTPSGWRATAKTDKVFVCFCAKGRRICLFKTRKEKICRWRFKKDKFWVLIWCEGSGKSVCASASHCG